jgi:TPR repeat protein
MYEIGRGVSLDYAEALKWYRRAAEQGWAPAHANLGLAYLGGVGVPANLIEGDKWLRIAVQLSSGDEQARYDDLREALEKKMSTEDVVEAWQRAREWLIAFQRR